MNVITRGIRGATRSPLRAGAIVIMLAMSIGLIVAMLAAKAGVEAKINEVKASAATGITVRPAGVMGFAGGGDPLTAAQVVTVTKTDHAKSVVSSLSDQLATTDTSLTPSLELGAFGQRMQRFENSSGTSNQTMGNAPEGAAADRPAPTPRTTVTGTTDPNSVSTDGSDLVITSGSTITGAGNGYEALVGTALATKNSLAAGGTFTMYGQTFTVKGIYKTGNQFQDSGILVPLATLQTLTAQTGAVTTMTVAADSADNVASVVSSLKTALGDKADITSDQQRAETSVTSLGSISSLASSGVIGATIAAAVIVLLTMTMIVRERRREIGVIKAIGGTSSKVIIQFVTEAMTLTVIGGLIGLVLGVAVSGGITKGLVDSQSNQSSSQTQPRMRGAGGPGPMFITNAEQGIRNITSTINPNVIAAGIGLTFVIAIVGSALPAWLISRVRPAEVLRAE